MGISIKGMGYYTPENVLTNFAWKRNFEPFFGPFSILRSFS